MSNQTILRLPQVQTRLGLSRSSIYLLIKKGELVRPIKLGERAIGWPESDIEDYINKKIREREQS